MKKILFGIAFLAVSCMLGTTALAGSSAPKSFCYQIETTIIQVMMTLKSLGTIKTANGSVKQYAIHGTQLFSGDYSPTTVTGTATFIDGVLRFNHTGIVRPDGEPGTVPTYFDLMTIDGRFDTATGTGAASGSYLRNNTAGGTVTPGYLTGTISVISCDSLSIAASTSTQGRSISGMGQYTLESE